MLLWILGFTLLGSLGAIFCAGLFLTFPHSVRKLLTPSLMSFATGTLLAAAFLGMIPAALELADGYQVSASVLAGIILFFVVEKLILWRHCRDRDCDPHERAGPLILIGDAVHNFTDGVVIAAAFLTSVPLGIATAVAIIAHEIPQEVSDFAILLESGFERKRALLLNSLASLTAIPGALIAYFWLAQVSAAVPYVLAISASSFIYIAAADLIPTLQRQHNPASSVRQFIMIIIGIAIIGWVNTLA
ncbi:MULTISPECIES: ZIP family metal transporter [Idiomarina]|jgi:zinc and cadmium transporter|uniref:ZIP family metal transporter n=1 Tax=Idiomarina abyssalis TaxID=86102 RepID=A0A8I1GDT2_9GAMM|nr:MULTISPECIES: ZIP family metal transporter [Idiomarina]MAO68067.1 ZIP zinc transporter [Idiomarina sp.]MBF79819.1 ZIP zinc transporter [Idiomarina sp.]MBH95452.1 ZIP zinc transporter [Idiomarina sp.]MBJ7267078.1 ZIP family metal transporter [Idiomarina abyssalis]MBJ7274514.1 ZIP family metal transporter [Idiomarina abyssalis]|tara:strand:- start:18312 stop:19049 length:738 start_codon:yes stop_codon:yes gene_type:complete